MKPFDLEAAKNGAKIVSRDGRNVKFIAYVPEIKSSYKLICFIEGDNYTNHFNSDGSFDTNYRESSSDLFMATTKKTGYVHIYESKDGSILSEIKVSESPVEFDGFITCKIEWED